VDALLANAGHGLGRAFLDQDFNEAQHVINTNITGTIHLIHKVGRDMRGRGQRRSLITGSIAGYMPGPFSAVYNGTKAFINSFSFALRNELKDTGVTVTCLIPGATETEFLRLVSETISDVTRHRSGGLISFGVLGVLWAASGGVTAVIGTLNAAYDAREERSFWKIRLIAISLTVMLALLVVGGTALVMFGDRFAVWFGERLGMGPSFTVSWGVIHYLVGLALLFLGLELIYYFGPNVEQDWKWVTPGAVFAVVSMVVASLLFSLYLRFAPNYSATYGSLGAVIVLAVALFDGRGHYDWRRGKCRDRTRRGSALSSKRGIIATGRRLFD
jgi:YihY family inner membrane protein